MKPYHIFLILALSSCGEDKHFPGSPDRFVGSWELEHDDTGLRASFDVSQEAGDLIFHNINIDYPEIPEAEILNYHVEAYGRTPVNTAFKEMMIFGSNDTFWITLVMRNCSVRLETPNTMNVFQLDIEMINREPVWLDNQAFSRTGY